MDRKLFDADPRDFALDLVANGLVSSDHLLLCALKYMSHDDVRDMLDCNELSPRFDEEDEEESEEEELEEWLEQYEGDHDTAAMRVDVENGNLEIGDDERAAEYEYEHIVRMSIINGLSAQARQQAKAWGLDYASIYLDVRNS